MAIPAPAELASLQSYMQSDRTASGHFGMVLVAQRIPSKSEHFCKSPGEIRIWL